MKTGVIAFGHDGPYKLVKEKTGKPIDIGDKCRTFRREPCTLKFGHAPHKSNSEGKVQTSLGTFYASVIGAKWVPCQIPVTA
jgi:hypothetical protein